MSAMTERDEKRFVRSIVFDNGGRCWNWIRPTNSNGYGVFNALYEVHSAHRWAYMLWVGEVPSDLEIDHLCRNRTCVRPDHLEAVSKSENKKRTFGAYCKNGHLYDYVRPDGRRGCKKCRANASARYYGYPERW